MRRWGCLTLIGCGVLSGEALADPVTLYSLGSGVERLRFHMGEVENHQPKISPVLPDIPGPASAWMVSQWGHETYLRPDDMQRDDPASADSRLGPATYMFATPDGHSHLRLYYDQQRDRTVYDLYERGGSLTASGGANLALSIDSPKGFTLDRRYVLSFDAKISAARVSASEAARRSGAVLAQVFSGFIIQFPDPQTGKISTVFLQIPIAMSSPFPAPFVFCQIKDGHRIVIFDGHRPGDPQLPFVRDDGPLQSLSYSVNDYVAEMLATPRPCGADRWSIPPDKLRFEDWKINGFYIGLETEDRDLRPESSNHAKQGYVEAGLQITNLKLTVRR